jgi:hemerythrin superfamily protein
MNALEFLQKDHDAIRALFETAKTYQDMKRLFERIKDRLEAHARLEETFFYPQFQDRELLRDLVHDAKAQHAIVKELLGEMEGQNQREFQKNFQTLKAEVQLHFHAEEGEIFPQIQSLKDGPDLTALGEQLAADILARQSAPTSPAEKL